VKLEDYRASAPFEVPAATIEQATDPAFTVPALQTCRK
jgi:hypothetical protein